MLSAPTGPAAEWSAIAQEQLTIVIPSYRCAAYLPAAAASALHAPARRILIADDGSGPEGLKVARALEKAQPGRVRVLASPVTRGTAVNMNEAAEHVETPFFAKLDGDDVLLPGYLAMAFPAIASRPQLAILAGRDLRIAADEATEFQPELLPSTRRQGKLTVMSGAEAYRFIVMWSPNPTSSGVIYRTAAFREVGGYDSRIPWGEDWEIWLRLARRWQVGYMDTVSALYRIHGESSTALATQHDRLCYGYDAVFRRAAEMCDDAEVLPIIRRRMLGVAKQYVGAAARQLPRSRRASGDCCRRALLALSAAMGGFRQTASSTH